MRIAARLGLSGLLLVSASDWSQSAPAQSSIQDAVDGQRAVTSAAANPVDQHATDRLIEEKCPGLIERQRRRDSRQLMAAVAEPTRPALRRDLLAMMNRDQELRNAWIAAGNSADIPQFAAVAAIDAANLVRLKHIIIQDGFPTRSMVGDDGVNAAWLLVQHADSDPDFQARVLKILAARVQHHEFDLGEFAMLTDRVLVHAGKPQRYGTQFQEEDGDFKPGKLENPADIDERRASVGLGPIADYVCLIRVMYGASGGK